MTFVTVGTQTRFDQMIVPVDDWAGIHGHTDVIAQIGDTEYRPKYMKWFHSLGFDDYREYVKRASLIVSYADVGAILLALDLGKPIIVMPHVYSKGDYQLAAVKSLSKLVKVNVVRNPEELRAALECPQNLSLTSLIDSSPSNVFAHKSPISSRHSYPAKMINV